VAELHSGLFVDSILMPGQVWFARKSEGRSRRRQLTRRWNSNGEIGCDGAARELAQNESPSLR
jgi:hypothetical protein